MAFVKVADFREQLVHEIETLDGGLALASEVTGISERGLRRILSGRQKTITDSLFDRICTAFQWDHWDYKMYGAKEPTDPNS